MELEKLWSKFSEKTNENNITEEVLFKSQQINSKAPLEKITKTLKIKLGWGILFAIVSVLLMIYHMKNFNLLLLLSLSTVYFLLSTFIMYKKIDKATKQNPSMNIKQYIQNYYLQVKSLLKNEEAESIFTIPVFTIIGVIYSGLLIHGSFDAILMNNNLLLVAVILMATIVPVVILLVKWANKKAFGEYLKNLKMFIDDFDDEN